VMIIKKKYHKSIQEHVHLVPSMESSLNISTSYPTKGDKFFCVD